MERILAENESLNNILRSINLNLFEIENHQNIRIISKNKPNCVIITVEADIAEDVSTFLSTDNHTLNQDIEFESTIFDFVVCKMIIDGTKKRLVTTSLFDLILNNNLVESPTKEDWNLESLDFTCFEVNISESTLDDDLKNSDMKTFG